MHTGSHTLPTRSAQWPQALKTLAASLAAVPGTVLAYLNAAARRAAHRREMRALSDAELHDLGLHRSEIDSCWAESEGLAEPTRLHLVPRRGGLK
jgi:uncharacterized protein YjiS (DUF1127 family)